MKRFSIVLLTIFFSFSVVQAVFAQATSSASASPTPILPATTPINLTLSPVTLQFELKPGEQQTADVKIRNNGTETEHLQATFGSFAFNPQSQDIDLSQQIPDEEKDWITIDQPLFSVGPQEWKTLKIAFSPPKESSLTHYYAVIFSRQVPSVSEGGTAQVSGAPAILVLTNIDSPLAKRELQVDQFFAKRFWVEFLPQTFTLSIKNTGNVHLRPSGNIFIDGPGQKDLAVLSINPNNSVVLPNSSRQFEIEWSDGFPKYVVKKESGQIVKNEKGDGVTTLQWNFSEADRFRIGKYTAHLLLVYDNGQRDVPIESSISFWVIPWRICIAVFFVVIFVLIGLRSVVLSVLRSFFNRNKK